MNRLTAVTPENATGRVKDLFDDVQRELGMVPNIMRTMAVASSVLEAYLQMSGTLASGTLSAKLRNQIALTVAEANGCGYCLAAHSAVGAMLGLSEEQIHDSRRAAGSDARSHAALRLARSIVDKRGNVSDDELADARSTGLDDAAIAEVVASVALNIFTNYFNKLARTEVDFPAVAPLKARAEACTAANCSH